MFQLSKYLRAFTLAIAVACVSLAAGSASADTLHLKDGRVLEGKLVREGKGFIYFKVKVGTVESEQLFSEGDIAKIVRDDPTPKTDENIKKNEDAKKGEPKKDEKKHTGATRIAIVNFGCPSEWQGKYDDMVGVQVAADAFKKAIPLLEKDNVDVVVVRVKSGGGYGLEVPKFNDIFDKEYKPKFRLVAWIESAISAAAMSPWVIEEMYFLPQGNIGACTGWSGNLVAVKGIQLEMMLQSMEVASARGKKDPRIMRAMQIMEPLSVDIDDNGEVHWRQDELGEILLNKKDNIYTMNASDAVRTKFARGVAGTKEELAKAMGLQEVEWVGQAATDLIDKSIRDNDGADKYNQKIRQKYLLAVSVADQLPDKERRGVQLAKARQFLNELRNMAKLNPNFEFHLGLTKEWFEQQEEILKRIAQKP